MKNIRIVLVNPSHPGNIGAAARAMKTMGLERLILVSPREFPSAEATARAVGADDVLDQAVVCDSLEQAIDSCQLVVATSARARSIDWPALGPEACAQKLVNQAGSSEVALVFGRERTGLTNAELDQCQYMVSIPVNPEYSSLNLAAAVQIMGYEIRLAAVAVAEPFADDSQTPVRLATQQEMQGFYQHLEEVLVEIGFFDATNPRKLMRRLYRLFNRAEVDEREMNILRGILTAVQESQGKNS